MANRLTEDELERIESFVNTPKHARTPEMLVPEAGADDDRPGDERTRRSD